MGKRSFSRAMHSIVSSGMALSALSASAAFVNTPVPSNAYITKGGLDWAWASPLPAPGSGFDLSYQSAFGWRVPTAAELTNAPLATDFVGTGANVPLGGNDPVSGARFSAANPSLTGSAACAVPYFSTTYRWCDWQDGLGQPFGPWAGMAGAQGFGEQLVVRTSTATAPLAAVPTLGREGFVLLSLGLGLLGMGRWMRGTRRR